MSVPGNRQQRRRAAALGTAASFTVDARPAGSPVGTRGLIDQAVAARDRGDFAGALKLCHQAVNLDAVNPEIHFTAATVLEASRDLVNAIDAYRHVLRLRPGFLPALVNSAACLADIGELLESLEAYRAVLKADPGSLLVRHNIARVLMRLKRPADAAVHLRVLAAARHGPADYSDLAEALDMAGDREGALAAYDEAIKHGAPAAPARLLMARVELVRGDSVAARTHVEAALAADPHNPHAHLVLANNFAEEVGLEERIASAQVALERSRGKPDQPTVAPLHFALARFNDRAGRYDEAFRHLESGNALFAERHMDEDKRVAAQARAAMDRYGAAFLEDWQDRGSASEQPAFVFGLPRSGTSLLEQILASHKQVSGLGEHDMMAWIAPYLHTLTPDRLQRASDAYIASYPAKARDKRRVIDKSLDSYLHVGLILLMFPKAKLINCLRHPLDVAFSAWSQLFGTSAVVHSYSFDRLVAHMRLYGDLMGHWHRTFPGRILDVRYEDLVTAPEATARRAVAHLDLDWDPDCLRFHQTPREVRTASVTQVRQPIYQEARGRWRAYQRHLEPLQSGLGDLVAAYHAGGDYGWAEAGR